MNIKHLVLILWLVCLSTIGYAQSSQGQSSHACALRIISNLQYCWTHAPTTESLSCVTDFALEVDNCPNVNFAFCTDIHNACLSIILRNGNGILYHHCERIYRNCLER